MAEEMEYGPDRILRLTQLDERERLLKSHDIWLCAACETCGAHCPNGINVARVMDALRVEALHSGLASAEPDAVKFHKLFLSVVQNFGRMHEASLLIAFKLLTLNLIADMDSGLQLFIKGKVPLVPKTIPGRQQIKQIYLNTAQQPVKTEPITTQPPKSPEVQ